MSARKALLSNVAAILLLLLVPVVTKRNDVVNTLILVFLYVCLAQSWNLIAGFAGQPSLGHAAFFGLGALAARFAWVGGVPFPLALLLGGVVGIAFALIVGVPSLRLRGTYFAIGTLGLGEISRITVGNTIPTAADLPGEYIAAYTLVSRYYLLLMLAVLVSGVLWIISRSKFGLGLIAVREDEDAAEASGVSTFRQKLWAFVLSSFFAGLTGGAFAYYQVSYFYDFPFSPLWTFDALMIAYVGGKGTVIGPIIGAFFFAISKELLAQGFPGIHIAIFGALFVVVVMVLPGGLVEMTSKIRRFVTFRKSVTDRQTVSTE